MKNWFVGPSYVSQSPAVDAERTVNFYVEAIESPGGKARAVLYPTPGIAAFCTLDQGPVRGMFHIDGRLFAVGGSVLYEIQSTGATIVRGAMALDTNSATLCANGDAGSQLMVTSGGKAYVYNLGTNAFAKVSDTATMGGFVDGYFAVLDSATSTLYVSALEDGTTWDPLDVGQRSVAPDRLQALLVGHREIWLIGSLTSEVWQHTGDVTQGAGGFAYYPPSGIIQHGTAAPYSAAMCADTPIWLSQNKDGDRMVIRMLGYGPSRISTHAVEYALSQYSTVSDAVATVYQDQGHTFYCLNFPTAGTTWVYDAATNLWHERGWWDVGNMTYAAWRPQHHAYAFGKHLVGDRLSGAIYEMAVDIYTDAEGAPLRRLRRAPYITNEATWQFHHSLQIDVETGLGNVLSPGNDPTVSLRWSDDWGHTWSQIHTAKAGQSGQYVQRVRFLNLGRTRGRCYETVFTDPIPWRVVDAFLTLSQGQS